VTGGQGVAGSNPAVSTGSDLFSKLFLLHQNQQKSQLVVQRLFHRPAPRACHGAAPEHVPRRQSRQADPARGPTITEPPRICTTTPDTCEPAAPSPAHPLTAGPTLTGAPQLPDAGRPACSNQACPRHRRRKAAGMRAAPRTGRHDRSDLHRHLETRLHPRHGEVPSRSAANAMY